jgi:hypothetical protein
LWLAVAEVVLAAAAAVRGAIVLLSLAKGQGEGLVLKPL